MVDLRRPALVVDVGSTGPRTAAVDTLRQALGDPALEVVYWRPATGSWIDEFGRPGATPAAVAGRALTPIERRGERIAALIHDPVLLRNLELLRTACQASSEAIDSARSKAELCAQLCEVQASRARIVEVRDRDRRQLERDLHDGAQRRLLGLALSIRVARRKANGHPGVTELLVEAARELDEALADLQDLGRGFHPAIVVDAGLGGALKTLTDRPGISVSLSVDLPARLPELAELGAYYFVTEALANANKHSGAATVAVRATVKNDMLRVAVSDDGRGGASAAPGSGLEGLADRVSALGGRLVIDSPLGGGTTVIAAVPLRLHQSLAPSDPTDRGTRALKWIGWENCGLPREALELRTEEENLDYGKALVLAMGGNAHLTAHQRDWMIGYLTAAGHSERMIDAVRTYDGADRIEDVLRSPRMAQTRREIIYDALRVWASDGAAAAGGHDHLLRAADALGISRAVVAGLEQIVMEEQALRQRRYDVIVDPAVTPELERSWARPRPRRALAHSDSGAATDAAPQTPA